MLTASSDIVVSLTQFLNFVTKPPEQQLTVVREIRKQHDEGYDVPPDIYKQFREAVIRMHKRREPKAYLGAIAAKQTEASRMKHYPLLVDGYKRFLGRKNAVWIDPPAGIWARGALKIRVRPELGLVLDGTPVAIKMWLRDDQTLNKRRAELVVHMMREAMPEASGRVSIAILDVRKGKAFFAGKSDHEQSVLLRAQARSFVSMYREL